jgi:hypothetical protein
LTTKEELSGLLRLVLRRLPRVLENGIGTLADSGAEIIEQNYDKYMLSSNPIRPFIENCVSLDNISKEAKEDVYDAYKRFCNHYKLGVESYLTFGRILKGEHHFKDGQYSGSDRRYYWKDYKLTSFKGTEGGQSTLSPR